MFEWTDGSDKQINIILSETKGADQHLEQDIYQNWNHLFGLNFKTFIKLLLLTVHFQSKDCADLWCCYTQFVFAVAMKVFDPNPAQSSVFSDKGQIVTIYCNCAAQGPWRWARWAHTDESRANERGGETNNIRM